MSTPARRRLMRDFKKLQEDPPAGISGAPTEDNILIWHALIFGPQETPFEDGTFKVTLEFTEEYPNKPPSVRFQSKMFHPNVYADGSVCLDILQNRWSPTYDAAAILTSIQSLLDEPNPNSPANSVAAQLYQENRREYEKRVQHIVEQSWAHMAENEPTCAHHTPNMDNVKLIVPVFSGKGGVGKSTVASQLSLVLSKTARVGLLDADLCGPNIPTILGLQEKRVHQSSAGWVPVKAKQSENLKVMSIGFLLNRDDDPVIWRGPKKNAMIKDFFSSVLWEELDYLIVDTPPGTSDEHISVVENLTNLNLAGAVLVTTPQAVSVADVRREITFCKRAQIPILGIVENMSGYVCPHCSECTNIFSTGSGEQLASYAQVPFLGRLPIDPNVGKCMESGIDFCDTNPESDFTKSLLKICEQIKSRLA